MGHLPFYPLETIMQNRREFLKCFALLGAAATLPVHNLWAASVLTPKPTGNGLTKIAFGNEMHQKQPPRKITIPDAGEFKVLKGDFHMHTLFSDGHVMPKDRVDEAIDNGLDVISITDHIEHRPNIGSAGLKLAANNDDHNWGYNFAKPVAERSNLILVRGTEITKSMCHFNALFIQDANPIAAEVADWRKMLAVSAEQGGFNFWNHPDFPGHASLSENVPFGFIRGEPLRFFDEIEEVRKKGHVHGIEVFNGRSYYPIVLDWCNDRNLVPITVTDIHQSDWNTYGHQNPMRPMTLILAKERTHDSVKEAFFAGRLVGWAANMILGKQQWVEKLFRSSVEIKKEGNAVTLRNISDIPCLIGDKDLAAQGTLTIAAAQKLTVNNWFVGTNKPLEIVL